MTLLYALHKRGGGRGGEEEESLHGAQYLSSTERETTPLLNWKYLNDWLSQVLSVKLRVVEPSGNNDNNSL